MFDTIVIASDGSAHGDRALAMAQTLVNSETASVTVVHVTELVGGKGGLYPEAADESERRARISAQVDALRDAGVSADFVTPVVRIGGPAHVIADIADSLKADLIVVGSRGHSLLSKIILGSVPIRLLQLAHCPVLVVPLPEDANAKPRD